MNSFFLHRFDWEPDGRNVDVLLAFVASTNFDAAAFSTIVEQELEQRLAPDELIILAPAPLSSAITTAFTADPTLNALAVRLRSRTAVTLLTYDQQGEETGRALVLAGGEQSAVELAELRTRGITAIFREHGGFIESAGGFHFENPSGRHTDRFIRLSNLLVRQVEITFMAVCCLPHLKPAIRQVYIDTPALYAIVSAVNEQRRLLAPAAPVLQADNFRSYMGLDTYPFARLRESVALVSASSSGGLAGKLAARGFGSRNIVHLLFLGRGTKGLQVVADLKRTDANPLGYDPARETHNAGQCRLCDSGSKAIRLRGDQFDVAGPQPEPLVVNRTDAPAALREAVARLVGTGALTVGLAAPPLAPRRFHVVTDQLISAPKFQERLSYFTRRHIPANVRFAVLCDAQDQEFAQRVRSLTGGSFAIVPPDQLDSMNGGGSTTLTDAVLVLASVIESGRGLLDISRDLRNICPKAPIIYFVGLAKSESRLKLEALTRTLTQTDRPVAHSLVTVENLLLPPSSGANPWLQELEFLSRTRAQWGAHRAFVDARLTRLRSASAPLTDDLFLDVGSGRPLKLQLGFVFWPDGLPDQPHTQADVYFTIASVLQELRSADAKKPRGIRTNWFQQTLLAPANFGRFNDGIIQASLLRAATTAELDYSAEPSVSAEAARIIRRVIRSSAKARGEAATEFLLAIGTKRLKLAPEHLKDVLADAAEATPLVRQLLGILRRM